MLRFLNLQLKVAHVTSVFAIYVSERQHFSRVHVCVTPALSKMAGRFGGRCPLHFGAPSVQMVVVTSSGFVTSASVTAVRGAG